MSTQESIYEPINGQEAKRILFEALKQNIEKIPYLKVGNAFHKFRAVVGIIITAFPTDCPVPEAEFEILKSTPEVDRGDFKDFAATEEKIKELENKRERLLAGVEKIDQILEICRPQTEIEEVLDAGDTPDELRIAHNMPTPMLRRGQSGRRAEVFVNQKR